MTSKKLPGTSQTKKKTKSVSRELGSSSVANEQATGMNSVTALLDRIIKVLERARSSVIRSVNSEMILAYWHIGREIVEHLQQGSARADYGDQLLQNISTQLTNRFGRGFSTTNLRYFRLFYQTYADREPKIREYSLCESSPRLKHHEASDVLATLEKSANPSIHGFSDRLSWTHYRTLIKVEHVAARHFYEIETECEGWSVPQLERQINTQLFARLLKSRDKAGVMELATRGQVIERPVDALKHPYVCS
jgi:hypothetical protein